MHGREHEDLSDTVDFEANDFESDVHGRAFVRRNSIFGVFVTYQMESNSFVELMALQVYMFFFTVSSFQSRLAHTSGIWI